MTIESGPNQGLMEIQSLGILPKAVEKRRRLVPAGRNVVVVRWRGRNQGLGCGCGAFFSKTLNAM
jgi:hypothetical protein